jgi:hypothetical protein
MQDNSDNPDAKCINCKYAEYLQGQTKLKCGYGDFGLLVDYDDECMSFEKVEVGELSNKPVNYNESRGVNVCCYSCTNSVHVEQNEVFCGLNRQRVFCNTVCEDYKKEFAEKEVQK